MDRLVRRVKLSEPEIAGDYVVAEQNQDGSILLTPDASTEAMRERLGLDPVDTGDFEQSFGHLKSDDEG